MFRALAALLLLVAGASAAERHPQHDLVASSHGKDVQASLGSHCTPTNGAMVCADNAYPLQAEKRLPVHGGGRIRLEFGAEPDRDLPGAARPAQPLGPRADRARRRPATAGSGCRASCRRGATGWGSSSSYERGVADFEIDLKRHRH